MPDHQPRTLVIKDMDAALLDRLSTLAARHGRSVEDELVAIARDVIGGDSRPVAALPPAEVQRRRRVMEEVARIGTAKATPGPEAARSQDWLYDDKGMPA